MSAAVYYEPYKVSAGALALLVHGVFFLLLYFSFSWQMKPPQGMVVDIWDSLPTEFDGQAPAPTPIEKQEPVKPPKAEAAPALPPKADIDLKDKKKKSKAESTAAQKLAEKKAEQAERRMEEVERQAQARAQAQRKTQAEAAAAAGKVVDEYIAKIAAKIRRNIVWQTSDASKNIKAEFNVTLLPSGDVLNASLAKSSGNEAYDSAVERAILKAQPLPLPPAEKNMFNRFRDLRLKFSPAESAQ